MADLTKVLGTMMATGMAGRTGRGSHFARPQASGLIGGRGGVGQTAGLAALAYLGYKAYQDYQKNQTQSGGQGRQGQPQGYPQQTGQTGQAGQPGQRGSSGGIADMLGGVLGGAGAGASGSGGLGERLGNILRGGGRRPEPEPEPEATLDDRKALLLIRAMIAAAYADGELSPEERRQIVSKLDEAGAGPEEDRIIEAELREPKSLEAILRDVNDQETAEQVYLASHIAIRSGSRTEQDYLAYLASRLNIPPERRQEISSMV